MSSFCIQFSASSTIEVFATYNLSKPGLNLLFKIITEDQRDNGSASIICIWMKNVTQFMLNKIYWL